MDRRQRDALTSDRSNPNFDIIEFHTRVVQNSNSITGFRNWLHRVEVTPRDQLRLELLNYYRIVKTIKEQQVEQQPDNVARQQRSVQPTSLPLHQQGWAQTLPSSPPFPRVLSKQDDILNQLWRGIEEPAQQHQNSVCSRRNLAPSNQQYVARSNLPAQNSISANGGFFVNWPSSNASAGALQDIHPNFRHSDMVANSTNHTAGRASSSASACALVDINTNFWSKMNATSIKNLTGRTSSSGLASALLDKHQIIEQNTNANPVMSPYVPGRTYSSGSGGVLLDMLQSARLDPFAYPIMPPYVPGTTSSINNHQSVRTDNKTNFIRTTPTIPPPRVPGVPSSDASRSGHQLRIAKSNIGYTNPAYKSARSPGHERLRPAHRQSLADLPSPPPTASHPVKCILYAASAEQNDNVPGYWTNGAQLGSWDYDYTDKLVNVMRSARQSWELQQQKQKLQQQLVEAKDLPRTTPYLGKKQDAKDQKSRRPPWCRRLFYEDDDDDEQNADEQLLTTPKSGVLNNARPDSSGSVSLDESKLKWRIP